MNETQYMVIRICPRTPKRGMHEKFLMCMKYTEIPYGNYEIRFFNLKNHLDICLAFVII